MRVVIATVNKLLAIAGRSRRTRVACQALLSAILIVLLIKTVPADELAAAWEHAGLQTLLLGCACYAVTVLTSVRRWQILLRSQKIEEGAARLTEVFCIGLFCSLFLPSAAGGDAYRVFEVARRGRSTVRVLLATFQDRCVGLGAVTAFGFAGTCCYFDRLPANLAVSVLLVCGLGSLAVIAVVCQAYVIRVGSRLLAPLPLPAALTRWLQGKSGVRLVAVLEPLREAPPVNLWRTVRVTALALGTFLGAVAMYAVVLDALDARCDFPALCLIVSLVGIARMLPIALGGIGVSEGTFVYLAGMFGIAPEKAVPVALTVLAIGTLMSLLGGPLLLRRTLFGLPTSRTPAATSSTQQAPMILPLEVALAERGGTYRHAA